MSQKSRETIGPNLDIPITMESSAASQADRFLCGGSMNKAKLALAAAALLFSCTLAFGQDGYFSNWFERVDKTQSEQPHWMTPVATTTPRLEEEVRYDQDWLQHTDGYRWNEYDGAKGGGVIPGEKKEGVLSAPPRFLNNADRHGA